MTNINTRDVQMTEDVVLKKIEKLMALGASSNPNEAAAALAKAAELMQTHGITQAKLDRSKIVQARVRSRQSVSRTKDWELALVQHVAKCFGCHVTWIPGDSNRKDYWGRFNLVGPRDYVKLAEYAAESLLVRVDKARAEYTRQLSLEGWRRGPDMSAKVNGFCWGWVKTVGKAVRRFALETSAELRELVAEVVSDLVADRKSKNNGTVVDGLAYIDGIKSASDVEVARPMTQGEGPRLVR